jgi:hypothetical protein
MVVELYIYFKLSRYLGDLSRIAKHHLVTSPCFSIPLIAIGRAPVPSFPTLSSALREHQPPSELRVKMALAPLWDARCCRHVDAERLPNKLFIATRNGVVIAALDHRPCSCNRPVPGRSRSVLACTAFALKLNRPVAELAIAGNVATVRLLPVGSWSSGLIFSFLQTSMEGCKLFRLRS